MAGVMLANAMFGEPAVSLSDHVRAGSGQWLSEAVATFGLLAVIGILFNVFLIRGNLDSHLPDVIVPAAVLWVWMLRGTLREFSPARFGVAAVALVSTWLVVDGYAGSMNPLESSELLRRGSIIGTGMTPASRQPK